MFLTPNRHPAHERGISEFLFDHTPAGNYPTAVAKPEADWNIRERKLPILPPPDRLSRSSRTPPHTICLWSERIGGPAAAKSMSIDEIVGNFSLLDEWDDRYRYVIELGRALPPLDDSARTEANKVQGCASQVWLSTHVAPGGEAGPVLTFAGDSDAHIVRGLIALLFAIYSGKSARDILASDAVTIFDRLGLREHLTPQRSNGFRSMVERIRSDARAAMAAAA
jgi:cysteine desulfuration protein SufE